MLENYCLQEIEFLQILMKRGYNKICFGNGEYWSKQDTSIPEIFAVFPEEKSDKKEIIIFEYTKKWDGISREIIGNPSYKRYNPRRYKYHIEKFNIRFYKKQSLKNFLYELEAKEKRKKKEEDEKKFEKELQKEKDFKKQLDEFEEEFSRLKF